MKEQVNVFIKIFYVCLIFNRFLYKTETCSKFWWTNNEILKKRFIFDDYVLFNHVKKKKNRLNASYMSFICSLNYCSIVLRSDYTIVI